MEQRIERGSHQAGVHLGRRRRRTATVTATVAAICSLVVGGCTSAGPTANSGSTSLSNSGPLAITWYGSDARNKVVADAIGQFTTKSPGVTVQQQPTAFAQYWDRLSVMAAAKSLPCVPTMQTRYEAKYEAKGSLLPLDSLVTNGTINTSGISSTALASQHAADGKLYAIPYGFWFEGAVYNSTKLTALGVELPQTNWTWDKYVTWAHTVQPKLSSGVYALGDRGNQITQFQAFAQANGEDLFAKDKVGFSAKTLTDWFTLWNNAMKDGVVPPANLTAQDYTAPTSANLMAKGLVLVSSTGDNNVADSQVPLSAINGGTLEMVGSPTGGKPQVVGSNSWAIASNCTNVKDAAEFINYFVNTPAVSTTLQAQTGLPVDTSVQDAQLNDASVAPAIKARITLFQNLMKSGARVDVWPDKTQLLVTQFQSTYEQVSFGKTSISAAVASFMSQANTALAGF